MSGLGRSYINAWEHENSQSELAELFLALLLFHGELVYLLSLVNAAATPRERWLFKR